MPSDATMPVNLHGTAIAAGGHSVLIRGPSAAGKSDLALRAIALGPGELLPYQAMLVADDRVLLRRLGETVSVSCPSEIKGLIEVRGLGILRMPYTECAQLSLIADLVGRAAVERLPETSEPEVVCGILIPRIRLFPFEASAAIKLLLALRRNVCDGAVN